MCSIPNMRRCNLCSIEVLFLASVCLDAEGNSHVLLGPSNFKGYGYSYAHLRCASALVTETGSRLTVCTTTIWRWVRVHAERLVQQWSNVLPMRRFHASRSVRFKFGQRGACNKKYTTNYFGYKSDDCLSVHAERLFSSGAVSCPKGSSRLSLNNVTRVSGRTSPITSVTNPTRLLDCTIQV